MRLTEGGRSTLARGAVVVVLGLAGFAAWLAEVVWVKGWPGLLWLGTYPYAAIFVSLLVAVAILVAAGRSPGRSLHRVASFLVTTTCVGLVAFELARQSLYTIHSRGAVATINIGSLPERVAGWARFAALPLSAVLAAVGIYVAMRRFLRRPRPRTMLFLLVAVGFVWPASMLTIRVFPALSGDTDYIHAVKMGYPAFWVIVLVASAVALGGAVSREPIPDS